MLTRFKPTRARLEFEAVKSLAKDSFNEFFILISIMALFSLCVLATCIMEESITPLVTTLVVLIGISFVLYCLGENSWIYPKRFNILYKRKNKEA